MSIRIITRQLLPIGLFILSIGVQVQGQQGSNPFDLQHRVPKAQNNFDSTKTANPFDIEPLKDSLNTVEVSPAEEVPSVSVAPNQNPFDIQRMRPSQPKKAKSPILKIQQKKIDKPNNTRSGFLFWSLLGLMILLALLVTLYRALIIKIYRAFANENFLKLLQREQSTSAAPPYLFLYALFFISAGIFLFQVAYFQKAINFEFRNLAYSVLAVTIFFLVKHLVLNIMGFVFPISKELKQYGFTIIIFSIILGIILIPFNIFIAFAQDSLTKTGIILALIAVVAVYLFRGLRGVFIGSKFLALHKFHFFMYLCTVEIAPLLIAVKLMLTGASIQ